MTWTYRVAKKKDLSGNTHYSLVEAFMNEEGEIWGHTEHLDVVSHIQHDEYNEDEDVRDDILTTFIRMLRDIEEPFIDIDTFEYADSGFEEELEQYKEEMEHIKSDN